MHNNEYKYMQYVGSRYFSNRLSRINEVKKYLKEVDLQKGHQELNTGGTPLICNGNTAWVDSTDLHTLIIGSTGSMKTRAFIVPTILSLAQAGENMVISDTKGELLHYTSGYLKEKGYKINVLNFRNTSQSNSWNPLKIAYDYYKNGQVGDAINSISDVINSITENERKNSREPYWINMASEFIIAILKILLVTAKDESEFTFTGTRGFVTLANSIGDRLCSSSRFGNSFQILEENLPANSMLRSAISGVVENADTTRRCILAHIYHILSTFLNNKEIAELTSNNDIDLFEYGKEDSKVATFLIFPDEKTTFHCFGSMFVKQMYEILVNIASNNEKRVLNVRTNFILDEFANMPAIPDMSSMISAARSRNIRFFLVLQSNSQLIKKYGEAEAANIKTNCQNWCFLNSKELPMLREVVEYIGSDPATGKKIMDINELSRLEKKWPQVESLIIMPRIRPYISLLNDMNLYTFAFKDGEPIYPPYHLETRELQMPIYDIDDNFARPLFEDADEYIKMLLTKLKEPLVLPAERKRGPKRETDEFLDDPFKKEDSVTENDLGEKEDDGSFDEIDKLLKELGKKKDDDDEGDK